MLLLLGRLMPGTLAVDNGTETYKLGAPLLLLLVPAAPLETVLLLSLLLLLPCLLLLPLLLLIVLLASVFA